MRVVRALLTLSRRNVEIGCWSVAELVMTSKQTVAGMGRVSPIPGRKPSMEIGEREAALYLTLDPASPWQPQRQGVDSTVFRFKVHDTRGQPGTRLLRVAQHDTVGL